ncbi:hypothetical protein PGR6_57250 [Pseudomonas sp. GR 6-02]|nr:hypothetical protein PGR6_57250 [Pseudomonas sp. GR 6-02]
MTLVVNQAELLPNKDGLGCWHLGMFGACAQAGQAYRQAHGEPVIFHYASSQNQTALDL